MARGRCRILNWNMPGRFETTEKAGVAGAQHVSGGREEGDGMGWRGQ